MKVTINYDICCVVVEREPGDPRFTNGGYAQGNGGESRLLYHVKNVLNKQGFDLIKKRMGKDGHLVNDMQQYLRTRKPSGDPYKDIYIHNGNWAVKGAEVDFNEKGKTVLALTTGIFPGSL